MEQKVEFLVKMFSFFLVFKLLITDIVLKCFLSWGAAWLTKTNNRHFLCGKTIWETQRLINFFFHMKKFFMFFSHIDLKVVAKNHEPKILCKNCKDLQQFFCSSWKVTKKRLKKARNFH